MFEPSKIVKYFLLVIVVAVLQMVPSNAFAISGACSYHSGVNCSAGPTADGKVVCNDGWINSSVYYSDANECSVTSYCVYPSSWSGCMTEQDYDDTSAQVRAENFNAGAVNSSFEEAALLEAQTECRASIDSYNSVLDQYNQCMSEDVYDNNSYESNTTSSSSKYDIESPTWFEDNMNDYCEENYGFGSKFNEQDEECYFDDAYLENSCTSLYGPNSKYRESNGDCTCKEGYLFDEKMQCVDDLIVLNALCKAEYGENSYAENTDCFCSSGYIYDLASDSCVLPVEKVSSATTSPALEKVALKSTPNTVAVAPVSVANTTVQATEQNQSIEVSRPSKWYTRAFNWFLNLFRSNR